MRSRLRQAFVVAGVASVAAVALSACAGSDDTMGRLLAAPGKFTLYSCPEMAQHELGVTARMRALEGLMEKAGQDSGGRLASAMAYRPEYIALRGELNELRRAATEKECPPKAPARTGERAPR